MSACVASRTRPTPLAQQRIKKKPRKLEGKPKILRILEQKQAQLAAIGQIATLWSLFAPMVNIQTSGTVKPFIPYDYQIEAVQTIEENSNTIIVKSRQLGLSESICSYLLMRSLTEPGFSAVIFSKTQADASELGRRIRDMAISLGSLCPKLQSDSATKLIFKSLGRLQFLPVTARAARGIPSVSVVLFDEAAFIDGIDGVYQAAIPTLSMLGDRGKVIFNSTPNGKSGLFYRLLCAGVGETQRVQESLKRVREAVPANAIVPFNRSKNTATWAVKKWAKVFLHWRSHPIYGADPDWAEKTRVERQLTESQWNQEYELDFLEGSRNLFPQDLIDKASAIGKWSAPKPSRRYIAGIDPNLGGSDFFTAQVWDVTSKPYQLVAEYRECRKTKEYNLINSLTLISPYKPQIVSIESNNGGTIYIEEYQRLRPGWQTEGVCTTNSSKIANTDRLILLLERNHLALPPGSPIVDELAHFVESVKGSTRTRGAESGYHDDTVMAAAIAFAPINTTELASAFDYY